MTTQEFNFLMAIAQFGWSKAEYHWTYLLLFDPEGNDVAKFRLRSPVTVGRTRRTVEKSPKSNCASGSHVPAETTPHGQNPGETTPSSKNAKARARR